MNAKGLLFGLLTATIAFTSLTSLKPAMAGGKGIGAANKSKQQAIELSKHRDAKQSD